ncbi:hypothetical protein [Paraglaciecola sp. L1A13]|uniref:hypothetical protein n=1 Tax=Paraglaciecola sp. L1A13 TaxID=2686359 RepID=UPI001E2FA249|nr:hypothetical protein [Paraglaciecola sp. L1A13]
MITLILIIGCSHTQVHLYGKYLSEPEVERISRLLQEGEFLVDVNFLTFPESITRNSLVYSLMLKEPSELTRLAKVASNLGYDIHQEVPLFSNNHAFTHESIGLFLIPTDIDVSAQYLLESVFGTYQSKSCQSETQLILLENKTYSLVNAKKDVLLSGGWKVTQYPYVQLSGAKNDPWVAPFEVAVTDEIEYGVAVSNTYLMPLSDYVRFDECQFYKGEVQ